MLSGRLGWYASLIRSNPRRLKAPKKDDFPRSRPGCLYEIFSKCFVIQWNAVLVHTLCLHWARIWPSKRPSVVGTLGNTLHT